MTVSDGEPGRTHRVDDEREIIHRAQQGDQKAFRELYVRYADRVHRFGIMPLVRDRAVAEDLLSDTFVRALEHLPRFQWQGKSLLPWLIRIGKNLCLDYLRKSGRNVGWPEGFEHALPDPTDLDAESVVGQAEMADILRVRIAECMEALNPRYQKVLRLRLFEKASRAEAAAELEVTVGTLDVLLFRACRSFRKQYLRRYGSDADELEFLTSAS